ncbi:MAG: molecular chaperone HtpG [Saprospiraceae bacterium]|nr:molecular chaperone HtpG [Saprospiraceae bacterium]MDW8485172.1 molecular chaperone HtpG [Saprospiraceae bacterium]
MHKGTISVQTENIFPIIKKFLYSDHEIFLRELVSNAVDATTKLQTLAQRGEPVGELGDTTIHIIVEPEQKRLIVRDRGIGMSEEEVNRYLNQIAFSSAAEFLEKYKDSNIIGKFGLGFYSAFMVADKVEVVTKSYRSEEPAVRWTCEGSPEFTLEPAEKTDRGTEVILYINEENSEFLDRFRIEELLRKYCRFLPVPIQFGTRTEYVKVGEGKEAKEEKREVPNIINETHPLWKKTPTDLKDEDYLRFYRLLYPSAEEPMFWIHLNIDYPFHLTGVLYFPKLGSVIETTRNKIHLYCNQVFVTDDVRDIVPEWLQLLHGVIDSPDIPLNVSRSYLQSDANVKKISDYIARKVADKLHELFKNDRQAFQAKWRDVGVFVKYGMIADDKFQDRAMNFALVSNVKNEFYTLPEYKEKVKANQTDKHDKVVFIYTHDPEAHDALIRAAQARGYDVLRMDTVLDNHWMQHLEYRANIDVAFARLDSNTLDKLVEKDEKINSVLSDKEIEQVKKAFEKIVSDNIHAKVECHALAPDDAPVSITRPEFLRRMKEMQALHGVVGSDGFLDSYTVVVNTNHPLIASKLVQLSDENGRVELAQYLYDLAQLQVGMLRGEALTKFVEKTLQKL